ncbi:MAG: hypothetical protein IAE94_07175 [Chthoniobacterales bacterium]|nr:hypothetical protein [Chthoniobacterales bacterium]
MSRRKKSSISVLWLFLAAGLMLMAFVGARFFLSSTSDPFRTIARLDVPSYMDNANSLRGNVYKIEGEVSNSLAWSPTSGRLIAIDADDEVLPVLVTSEFNAVNIQKGQKFLFVLEVDPNGVLKTKKLTQQ